MLLPEAHQCSLLLLHPLNMSRSFNGPKIAVEFSYTAQICKFWSEVSASNVVHTFKFVSTLCNSEYLSQITRHRTHLFLQIQQTPVLPIQTFKYGVSEGVTETFWEKLVNLSDVWIALRPLHCCLLLYASADLNLNRIIRCYENLIC